MCICRCIYTRTSSFVSMYSKRARLIPGKTTPPSMSQGLWKILAFSILAPAILGILVVFNVLQHPRDTTVVFYQNLTLSPAPHVSGITAQGTTAISVTEVPVCTEQCYDNQQNIAVIGTHSGACSCDFSNSGYCKVNPGATRFVRRPEDNNKVVCVRTHCRRGYKRSGFFACLPDIRDSATPAPAQQCTEYCLGSGGVQGPIGGYTEWCATTNLNRGTHCESSNSQKCTSSPGGLSFVESTYTIPVDSQQGFSWTVVCVPTACAAGYVRLKSGVCEPIPPTPATAYGAPLTLDNYPHDTGLASLAVKSGSACTQDSPYPGVGTARSFNNFSTGLLALNPLVLGQDFLSTGNNWIEFWLKFTSTQAGFHTVIVKRQEEFNITSWLYPGTDRRTVAIFKYNTEKTKKLRAYLKQNVDNDWHHYVVSVSNGVQYLCYDGACNVALLS